MTPFELRFLAIAGLLHGVGLPVAAAIAPIPSPGRPALRPASPTELSIDMTSSELERESLPGLPGSGSSRSREPANPNADPRVAERSYAVGPILTADPLSPQEPAEDNSFPVSPDQPSRDPLSLPPSRREVDGSLVPGIGDGMAYLPDTGPDRRPGAPTQAPKREYDPDQGTKSVQGELRKKDAKLGMDFPGRGPIRAAFVGAVYSSGAPDSCSGVFSLSVSPNGKVTDVSLGGFTGGDAQIWAAVRKIAKAELSGVTLVMRGAFTKGATVSVLVKSERKAPSGGGSGWNGGTGANFDVTDIGASDVRVVTAVVNPQPLD